MMTTDELRGRASGAMTLSAHDAAAQRTAILSAIAEETIADLVREKDTLAWYRHGGGDFVFVEEGVSVRLECLTRVLRDDDEWKQAHAAACGLVFLWLLEQYQVEPPTWFLEHTKAHA